MWLLQALKHGSLVALFLSMTLAAAGADDVSDCNGRRANADIQIAACTRLVESGQLNFGELPLAFVQRGNGWQDKTDHGRVYQIGRPQRGLPDADQAVRLAPREANVLDTRARIFGWPRSQGRGDPGFSGSAGVRSEA
jgi:hypothetical protein